MGKSLEGVLRTFQKKMKRAVSPLPPFKELFHKFREVLASHNKAVEMIADMGEKLSGDYLFDVHYIESAYAELSTAVWGSIKSFDSFTRGRYPNLMDAFIRIDTRISDTLANKISTSGEMIVFLEDTLWDMYYDVGGKNAGLAEVGNLLKLNVPEAFFVTTHAFDEFIAFNGLSQRVETLGRTGRASETDYAALRDTISGSRIPPGLDDAFDKAIRKMRAKCRTFCSVAVRSSAEEEDGRLSFAGQFDTVLNVPLEGGAIREAYKKVVASLYSLHSIAYQRRFRYDAGKMKMAVGCVTMVDAVSSGVVYSVDPSGKKENVLISANWGLGKTVVEGLVEADIYRVKKGQVPQILGTRCGNKESMTVVLPGGGIDTIPTPNELSGRPVLDSEVIVELTLQAQSLEKHFRRPQDIEWAIDRDGRIFILQSRELRLGDDQSKKCASVGEQLKSRPVLMRNKGISVQKGIGSGTVYIVKTPGDIKDVPKGAILVSKRDFSAFVRLMNDVSAIITDVGTPTSHMASISREFRIPTIVNTDDATQLLRDGMEITVNIDDEGSAVYEGLIDDMQGCSEENAPSVTEGHEYLRKRYVLRHISPLNLIEPLHDKFRPEECKTMHDILRFIHEKSIMELVDCARNKRASLRGYAAVALDLPIPASIVLIDMGGALDKGRANAKNGARKTATAAEIASIPLKAVIGGMMYPGAWHNEAVPLTMKDFFISMTRIPDIHSTSMSSPVQNVAVASNEYVNLSLKFGYHFNIVDCYCSENPRNNHVYFRFSGGATDIVQRSRRVQFIALILKEYGFTIWTTGDLLTARVANIGRVRMEQVLDQLGRLIAFVRKLDALLRDDSAIEYYAQRFKEGNYELMEGGGKE